VTADHSRSRRGGRETKPGGRPACSLSDAAAEFL